MTTAQDVITGYDNLELMYTSDHTQIYKAVDADANPIILKVLRNQHPSIEELLRFRNQYTLGQQLDHPGLIPMGALVPYGNSQALAMDDVGGQSLAQHIKQQPSKVLPLTTVLSIAIQIAEILHYLGQRRVIHKDIKPANVLINPDSNQIWLIDFSIASLLPKETQEIKNPTGLEGTLAYLAPEQTGRMNRGIDYRADFYSLGVMLFELLAGELPFTQSDPMSLVHSHLAKQPPSICEIAEDLPASVGAIVHKLMAKNAEDRYQSALGLKHDLETCLHQLKEKASVEPFEIGQKDSCDRFTIPEKLYGRESEVAALLAAFDRVAAGQTEMMLVAGFSGIGKTAVVREVHKPITRQQGYFIKGKFDQFNRNVPLSAFVQALRDLITQLLSENDQQLAQWRSHILEAVGENGQVLIEVIPELSQVIGSQPPVSELSGIAAQNRFNALFQKFIAVFTTDQHPLVMFLDDLQWADIASLQLIKLLMQDQGHLLLLGAYRDNEVSPTHPFMLALDELHEAGTSINTITLEPLLETQVNQIVADTLGCQLAVSQPLSELIYQKTQGNPFFTNQFLNGLYKAGHIAFDYRTNTWQCDIVQVRSLALTNDVVAFMADRLQQLPSHTQEILKLAACIGAQFDLDTLAIVSEQPQTKVATALWKALQEGFVIPTAETYKLFQSGSDDEQTQFDITVPYKFLHDRVQQAAYSLIPADQQRATHLKIGRLLLARVSPSDREEKLFDIISHLNTGKSLISQPLERTELSQLNLAAGKKAKASTAYSAAVDYFTTGIELLPEDCWQSHYALTLNQHESMAEALYLDGDFEQLETIANTLLSATRSLLDQIATYEIKIQAHISQNQMTEAVQLALNVLRQLDIRIPTAPNKARTLLDLAKNKIILAGKSMQDLENLPAMSDPKKLAATRILSSSLSAAFIGAPNLFPLLVFQQVNLSVQYGNTPLSAFAYAWYGAILCGALTDIDAGYEFGQLALKMLEKFPNPSIYCKTTFVVASFVAAWKYPLKQTIPRLHEAYASGIETGDLEYAGWTATLWGIHSYWMGKTLIDMDRGLQNYAAAAVQHKQTNAVVYLNIHRQAVLNLMGQSDQPQLLEGACYSETENVTAQKAAGDRTGLFFSYLYQLHMRYLFNDFAGALATVDKLKPYEEAGMGLINNVHIYLFDSLTRLALYDQSPKAEQAALLRQVASNQKKLKRWAHFAPMNVRHKFHLVEAERQRCLSNYQAAADLYNEAIAGAMENVYIQEAALANELAAKFYIAWDKPKAAAGYLQAAHGAYVLWGAKAKTDQLESAYPDLLGSILRQSASPNLRSFDTVSNTQSINLSRQALSTQTLNEALDLTAILEASQSLSSTMYLDELLGQLAQIVLQNSGGDLCTLVLPDADNNWRVEAIATPEAVKLCSEPLENNQQLPAKLIHYVKNTRALVLIDNLKTDLPVLDSYTAQKQPKSLLCLPLLNQGQLIGLLHLENQLASYVFTRQRIHLLEFLCTQAAISLKNAQLYQRSQAYAQQLETSQIQLVKNEKMSALGNLVAGVAHEINNPVSFLKGNISPAKDYISDLFGLIDLLLEEIPTLSEDIEEEIEEIDLDFIRKDLPDLIGSMLLGVNRIENISNSLRTFSRADKDEKTKFYLHEGIDSTLLILRHRLKDNEQRPAIEIIKNYGDLPMVQCFPGQLNQVFMNILANGIDAIDETLQNKSFAKAKECSHHITITTGLSTDSTQVYISIQDSGAGIPEAVRQRIFDHLYTTKAVGKGTGLGLAIAQQIITENHSGSISVSSESGAGTTFTITLPVAEA
ncbi:ATP-binding sensor histidine kinase [cf. Phormidesmis sp. LEGE 11477]|uniref:trifunctional serine/threonine-protein kinase/ATP-binding protein/sensor histidine kinase n=1 Tax=cf. Phormidesmis sp. LEGE 11477 TaxID=1828680 RepID=UPI001881BC7A|nr:ATP-binding sensor histidine kinase [cf. Phormidesmis sp. LEGE 11477]MBE9063648.1 AAA family ATPase [cf. Phormidesmis sp. LEGE 11477]